MMQEEKTKSLPVSKRMVYDSYLKTVSKQGGAGIDRESIEMFNGNKSKNLYKIYNRMASGSYFPPPVRTVFIPKKQGGLRPLGIPTVGDRIAQGVVKDYLEPFVDATFTTAHLDTGQAKVHMMHLLNVRPIVNRRRGCWM
jgi:retron-type reverse transcriptase